MSYNQSLNPYSNYPPMSQSDWDNAPFNQSDPDPVKVDVCASITLSKSTTISVDDYTLDAWEDYDDDGEGHYTHTGGVDYDFSECDLLGDFKDQEYTIPQLLDILTDYLEADINNTTHHEVCAKAILNSCYDWEVDEEEVVRD